MVELDRMLYESTSNDTERLYHQREVQSAKVESSMVLLASDIYGRDPTLLNMVTLA
jgi:hypothetical protein